MQEGHLRLKILESQKSQNLWFCFQISSILPEKIFQFKFFQFEISLVTFTSRTLGNAILVRPLFTINNNMLNDFISFALPAHWHRHVKLRLRLNFQLISLPIARILAVKVQKRIDFHRQKNHLSNFYFVKYEPYGKKINVNLISFTEMYHNIFLISKISSFDCCCDVTRLDNTFQRFWVQVSLLHPSAQLKHLNCHKIVIPLLIFSKLNISHP